MDSSFKELYLRLSQLFQRLEGLGQIISESKIYLYLRSSINHKAHKVEIAVKKAEGEDYASIITFISASLLDEI